MLDSRRVNDLRLHIPEQGTELPLREGLHAISRDAAGLHVGADAADAIARLCLDRRGVWLTVSEGAGSVHVNGRRVRRMAMLRVGDAIYVDGTELLLVAAHDAEQPDGGFYDTAEEQPGDPRVILRGVGGKHHGRSFTLERPRLVGSAAEADIRIDDPAFVDRHAQLLLMDDRIVLRDLGSPDGSLLNGQPVRDALLQPGDQIVFDAQHRFVVEAPGKITRSPEALLRFDLPPGEADAEPAASTWRRWPWLLLAAVLIAGSLAALLMFGSGR